MSCISNLSPDALIILTVVLSAVFTQNLDANQLNVLGNVLAEAGAAILTKAAQVQALEDQQNTLNQIKDIEAQLAKLKQQLC